MHGVVTKRISQRSRAIMAALGGCLIVGGAHAAQVSKTDRAGIDKVMQQSAVAWSSNDLSAFMSGYEESPATVYVTGHDVVHGYQAIKDMYQRRFGHSNGMGTLTFAMQEYRALGDRFVLGLGSYRLVREGSTSPLTGVYTLIFHQTSHGWKIISDHTSS